MNENDNPPGERLVRDDEDQGPKVQFQAVIEIGRDELKAFLEESFAVACNSHRESQSCKDQGPAGMNHNNKFKNNIPTSVPTIFIDPKPWQQVDKHLYYNGVEKIGAALATRAPNRDGHALNKGEYERALAAERDGKIEAYVVAFRL